MSKTKAIVVTINSLLKLSYYHQTVTSQIFLLLHISTSVYIITFGLINDVLHFSS